MSDLKSRSSRATALVILGGLLVGGLVLDAADDDTTASAQEVVAGIAMPAARTEPTLSSTWYCAAGTAAEGGFGDHVVILLNPTDRDRTATITAVPGSIAPPPADRAQDDDEEEETTTTSAVATTLAEPAPLPSTDVDLPARSRIVFRMADLVQAQLVGAIVEVDGGEIAVEHELTGELGRATAPCSTTVSTSWSFPWGVTTRGNRELLVFMNPFPDDATVDVAFATDEGVRNTVRFSGFVVPGRSVVGAYIDEDVTRKEQVSAEVTVRGGRLVVDRVQTFTGIDGREGMTLGLGAPVAAAAWAFPDGYADTNLTEQIVVYNPGERVAEVDVEVFLDDPETNGVPEAFELTVQPGRYAIVDLDKEERIPHRVGHHILVRSANGRPVVAEQVVAGLEGAGRRGVGSTLGSPLGAPTWYLPGGGTTPERDEFLTVINLSDEDEVTYGVTALASGQELAVSGLQDLTLAPGGRAVLRLGDHIAREDLPLMLTGTGPIVVERTLYRPDGQGISQAMGIPLAAGTEVPDPL